MNIYYLQRTVDHSGNSGTGLVGYVFELENIGCILLWSEKTTANLQSLAIYNSLEDLIKIHGHNGSTTVVPVDVDLLENADDIISVIDSFHEKFMEIADEVFSIEDDDEDVNDAEF